MGNNTISITFDYNGGSPDWTVDPESLSVPQGPQRILWQLSSSSTGDAAFPATGGVVFKNGSNWPGSAPAFQNARTYAADEVNANPGPGKARYRYTINVVFNGTTYSHDPEVANEPPGPGPGEEPPKGKPKDKP